MDSTPLVQPFPMPTADVIRDAYWDLFLSEHGTDDQKDEIDDASLLPRPWDVATCQTEDLRAAVWEWYDAVVTWFNTEYVWDPNDGMIPPCWPMHPHLVHDIGVLADQRRRAAMAINSNALEEWHRYAVPNFLDRLRGRLKQHCDGQHQPNPARSRQNRYVSLESARGREKAIEEDLAGFEPVHEKAPRRPTLRLVDLETGQAINLRAGEVFP